MGFLRMILTAAKWIAAGYIAILATLLIVWGVVSLLNSFGAGL